MAVLPEKPMPVWSLHALIILVLLVFPSVVTAQKTGQPVTYDSRSLLINGKRELIFSGSIHYPRSTPDMWQDLISKAKHGGLNAIETYIFWNVHEPIKGQFNFEGRNDIIKFIKMIQENDMYVIIRFGPFIQAEFNHGGLPAWLRDVPGITFRTENEPFKKEMEIYVRRFVKLLQDNNLFAPQGGPIILAQIENEYNNIARAFKEEGAKYIQWAANLALSLDVGVPWVMCKQNDAPGKMINSCNGRNCGDTWSGPNHPSKPSLWTENWTAQYRVFGDPPSQRSAEDLAYSVARFFCKNGTLINYYMYHGGTNFGRTGASFMMTRYYDEAPLDEYGLYKEPKYGHLRDLHHALRLTKKPLLWGNFLNQSLGNGFEAIIFGTLGTDTCAAFLTNKNPKVDGSVTFRGVKYFLPHRSISILPDCKTVVFNTQRVNAQHNARTFITSKETSKNNQWQMYKEKIPKLKNAEIRSVEPLEMFNVTKDVSDYLWYTTSFKLDQVDLPRRQDIQPVVQASNLGHAMHGFVNGKYFGSGRGSKLEKSFVFEKPMTLKTGLNTISLLCVTTGMTDSGVYLERRMAGLHSLVVQGLNTGTLDLSQYLWGHKVGVDGEKQALFTENGAKSVSWKAAESDKQVTWYKRYFDAPSGEEPVAVDLTSMGKGLAWVNGEGIGRYWVNFLNPLGKPSQSLYHIPRAFLKPKDNLLVIFEEQGGKPENVAILTVRRDNICAYVSNIFPAHAGSYSKSGNQLLGTEDAKPEARLQCLGGKKVIKSIAFASFGNPDGMCGAFKFGSCHAKLTQSVVEKACVGKSSCQLPVDAESYGADPGCTGSASILAVQAKCSRPSKKDSSD